MLWLTRFSDWRPCSEVVSWSHGWVLSNPCCWPRRRPAQVAVFLYLLFTYSVSVDIEFDVFFLSLNTCTRNAHYEGGAVCNHARSLWRLEPLRIGWVHAVTLEYMSLLLHPTFLNGEVYPSSLSIGGVGVTWNGACLFGCVTSPRGGTCAWMKKKDSCWWTLRKPTPKWLPSALGPQRSEEPKCNVHPSSSYCSGVPEGTGEGYTLDGSTTQGTHTLLDIKKYHFHNCMSLDCKRNLYYPEETCTVHGEHANSCPLFFYSPYFPPEPFHDFPSRKRQKWPRSATWKEWEPRRLSTESLCASCSMCPPGYGSLTPQ